MFADRNQLIRLNECVPTLWIWWGVEGGQDTPKLAALNDYSVSRTLFRTTLIVVHLVTVGRIWLKSFIFLLNRRVNSSLYE